MKILPAFEIIIKTGSHTIGMVDPQAIAEVEMDNPDPALHRRLDQAIRDLEHMKRGRVPSASDLAAAPLLRGWQFHEVGNGLVTLIGTVHGHPQLGFDPRLVQTSLVLALDLSCEWARTVSRFYRLC